MMIRRQLAKITLLGSALLATGCPPPPPGQDTTAPQLLEVLVRLEGPTPPNPRGEFNITTADVTRGGLASDQSIHLLATAGDAESGIKSIAVVSELRWRCALGRGSEIIGTPQTASLNFTGGPTTAPSPVTPFKIDLVANPIAQTACATVNPGSGPVDIGGFVRVIATNGATQTQTQTSKTFIFDYADVGVRR